MRFLLTTRRFCDKMSDGIVRNYAVIHIFVFLLFVRNITHYIHQAVKKHPADELGKENYYGRRKVDNKSAKTVDEVLF